MSRTRGYETKGGKRDRIERELAFSGPLTDGQRSVLLGIAEKCPVHRTQTSEIDLPTRQLRDDTLRLNRGFHGTRGRGRNRPFVEAR
jgi:hypothetical protein